jgi:hypothetical protein
MTVWSLGNIHVTVQPAMADEPLLRIVTFAWNPVGHALATVKAALQLGRALGDDDGEVAAVGLAPPRCPESFACSRCATKMDIVAMISAATAQPAARRSPPAHRLARPAAVLPSGAPSSGALPVG